MNKFKDRIGSVLDDSLNVLTGKQEVDVGTFKVISKYSGEWKNDPISVQVENGKLILEDNDNK